MAIGDEHEDGDIGGLILVVMMMIMIVMMIKMMVKSSSLQANLIPVQDEGTLHQPGT